jgi:hypothetical protein
MSSICIAKVRDKNGKIKGYKLAKWDSSKDFNNITYNTYIHSDAKTYKPINLKADIEYHYIDVVNLSVTKDGRLIDKNKGGLINKNYDQLTKTMCEYLVKKLGITYSDTETIESTLLSFTLLDNIKSDKLKNYRCLMLGMINYEDEHSNKFIEARIVLEKTPAKDKFDSDCDTFHGRVPLGSSAADVQSIAKGVCDYFIHCLGGGNPNVDPRYSVTLHDPFYVYRYIHENAFPTPNKDERKDKSKEPLKIPGVTTGYKVSAVQCMRESTGKILWYKLNYHPGSIMTPDQIGATDEKTTETLKYDIERGYFVVDNLKFDSKGNLVEKNKGDVSNPVFLDIVNKARGYLTKQFNGDTSKWTVRESKQRELMRITNLKLANFPECKSIQITACRCPEDKQVGTGVSICIDPTDKGSDYMTPFNVWLDDTATDEDVAKAMSLLCKYIAKHVADTISQKGKYEFTKFGEGLKCDSMFRFKGDKLVVRTDW